jgi:hypothetical protein
MRTLILFQRKRLYTKELLQIFRITYFFVLKFCCQELATYVITLIKKMIDVHKIT